MLARHLCGAARATRGLVSRTRPSFTFQRCAMSHGIGVRPPVAKEGAPPTPRTTTHKDHVKMKKLTKQAAHLMSQLDLEHRQKVDRSKDDRFEVGDAVAVKAFDYLSQKRPSIYKGVVISIKNKGLGTTFRILNTYDGEKFEMTFPLYSPLLGPVKVLKKNYVGKKGKRIRRAKLYYLRDLPADKFYVP